VAKNTLWAKLAGAALFMYTAPTLANLGAYGDVQTLSVNQLAKRLNEVVVVDVRSPLEYQLLHIKGAINIPVINWRFGKKIRALTAKSDKAIVFYCGDSSCTDSYNAAHKAKTRYQVKKTYALKSGMLAWLNAYPDLATLRGKSPVKSTDLISETDFQSRVVKPMAFEKYINKDALLLDVRAGVEREGVGIFFGHEEWVDINREKEIRAFLVQAKASGKPLLVYDNEGHQTRWLQYALEDLGIKEYYFLDSGALGYQQMVRNMHKGDWDRRRLVPAMENGDHNQAKSKDNSVSKHHGH